MAASSKNDLWLVKSGDVILGPFSTDEVVRRVRLKEIVVIDEISAPRSRWAYLRDVPAFTSVVEEVRLGLMQTREDTEVQLEPTVISSIDTRTEPDFESELSKFDRKELHMSPAVEVPAQVAERATGTKDSPYSKPAVLPKNPFKLPGMMMGPVVLVMAVGFAIYISETQETSSPGIQASASAEAAALRSEASGAWKRGEFESALEAYKKAEIAEPGRADVAVRLAPLMVRLEGETIEAKRLLQAASSNSSLQDPELKKGLEMGLGLVALHMDDVKDARQHFAAAGESWMAQTNSGIAALTEGDDEDAIRLLKSAGDEPIALLNLARALIARGAEKPQARAELDQTLERLIEKNADYRQEALVIGANSDLALGNLKRAVQRVRMAIETDPEMTSEHFHDPRLSSDAVAWPRLLPLCENIDQGLSGVTKVKPGGKASSSANRTLGRALAALCLAKASRLDEATKILEAQLTETPADSTVNAVAAYVHMQAGRDDAARAALKLASDSAVGLAGLLEARLCTRDGNQSCAEDAWARLAAEPSPPLASLTGLASARFAKGDREGAVDLLLKVEQLSPRYLPLLRLREEFSK